MKATSRTSGRSASDTSALAGARVVFKKYYYLTKPGIIRGNLFTAIAGFLLAAGGVIHVWQLAAMISGLALVIASGCVCNNYLDCQLDIKMARTSRRALVTGTISEQRALVYAAILGLTGTLILIYGAGLLAAGLAVFGFIAYVAIYGIGKRTTVHGTVIGSISGAIPPLVGYAAAAGRLDFAAALLFLVLVAWQMPHFYAIAIYRSEDYKAAGLPILSVIKGFTATKVQMIFYAALFVAAVASLSLTGHASVWYGIAMTLIGGAWLLQIITGLRARSNDLSVHWARRVFGSSLLVLTLFCVAIGIDSFFA